MIFVKLNHRLANIVRNRVINKGRSSTESDSKIFPGTGRVVQTRVNNLDDVNWEDRSVTLGSYTSIVLH